MAKTPQCGRRAFSVRCRRDPLVFWPFRARSIEPKCAPRSDRIPKRQPRPLDEPRPARRARNFVRRRSREANRNRSQSRRRSERATVAETVAVTETATVAETETVAVTETATVAETEPVAETELKVIEFDESDFAAIENESIPPPAQPDAFQVYVRTLIEVALAAGAPGRVVEILPAMLGLARLDVQSLDENAIDALVSACLLARTEGGAVVRHDAFVAAAQVWRATLLGEDADFSACTTMLDEWSANLIATLAGVPNQREALRRDLRARGIAAFGIAA